MGKQPITPLFSIFEAKPQGYTIEHKPLRRDVLASKKNKASGKTRRIQNAHNHSKLSFIQLSNFFMNA